MSCYHSSMRRGGFLLLLVLTPHFGFKISDKEIERYRQRVVEMFHHAYDGYIKNAYPYDELRPITCDGHDTWGSYSLTLIDALDTLVVMGNYSEFRRVARLLINKMDFDSDINVSVFETNIRIVGGLVSAHLMSKRAGLELEAGWPCSGPLLRMAENVARRLLPAFDTPTGMPYGTVNLLKGVPRGETTVTCTAGVGTFLLEFGALSRLTGDPIFEKVAMRAMRSLWQARSKIGLVGNHIDVSTGKWTALDAGIGGGVDSYFEYLVKGAIMLDYPELLSQFHEYVDTVEKYLKKDDWYMWAHMTKGSVTLPVFTSLDCYWPGIQCMLGDVEKGMKTIHNFHQVWKQFGFIPEYYNIVKNEAHQGREGYPLRPELVESAMYLYQATKDPYLLKIGIDMLESIEHETKTDCGYATIKDVTSHKLENRMESFFLAETTKYLYLLFDRDNFIHNTGSHGTIVQTPNGECIIDTGAYVFNTEAHPIDTAALYCCSAQKKEDDQILQEFHDNIDLLALLGISDKTDTVQGIKWSELRGRSENKTKDMKLEKVDSLFQKSSNIEGNSLGTQENIMRGKSEERKKSVEVKENAEGLGTKDGEEVKTTDKAKDLQLEDSSGDTNKIVLKDKKLKINVHKITTEEMEADLGKENYAELVDKSKLKPKNDKRSDSDKLIERTEDSELERLGVSEENRDGNLHEQLSGSSSRQMAHVNKKEALDESQTTDTESDSDEKSSASDSDISGSDDIQAQSVPGTQTSSEPSILKQFNMFFDKSKSKTSKNYSPNLEGVLEMLKNLAEELTHGSQSPNVKTLHEKLWWYSLQQKSRPELMTCKAQPFHMRLSVMGEMLYE